MRVLIGGLGHESNSFSTLYAEMKDFKIVSEEQMLRDPVSAFIRKQGLEVIPAFRAYAPPSGLVRKETYLRLKEKLLRIVENAGKLDGVCLILHGAMEVEGIGSGELDLIKDIREIVGEQTVIAASLDLHGNIPVELTNLTDILVAYRTAPHVDVEETRLKAARLLVKCLKRGIETTQAIVKPPLLLPGEYFVTLTEPAASLMRELDVIDRVQDILISSLLVGCAWTDAPYSTPSVIVVAEKRGRERALEESKRLALEIWKRRKEFKPDVEYGEPDEILDNALKQRVKPIVISDSGDNVTAGAGGDIPLMLEKLLERDIKRALVAGIYDEEAVENCKEAGINSEVKLSIGGKVDRVNGYPLQVKGRVLALTEKEVLLRVKGVDVIVAAERRAYTELKDYERLNVRPQDYEIVVVKVGYLFSDIRNLAAKAYMALTPGFTTLKIENLPYKNVIRPIYPLDKDFTWHP